MAVLLCDLSSVVTPVSFAQVHGALAAANGGEIAVDDPQALRDEAFDDFAAGRIGEPEFTRHLRARLAWHGTDPDLLAIMADLYGSVDVAVMELVVDLRRRGWHLVGILDEDQDADPMRRRRWGGQFAEQLTVFHQVYRLTPSGRPGDARTDPRHFAALLRAVPAEHGPRLYVDSRPQNVAAARRAGLDAHLFRGAAGLRSMCLQFAVGV